MKISIHQFYSLMTILFLIYGCSSKPANIHGTVTYSFVDDTTSRNDKGAMVYILNAEYINLDQEIKLFRYKRLLSLDTKGYLPVENFTYIYQSKIDYLQNSGNPGIVNLNLIKSLQDKIDGINAKVKTGLNSADISSVEEYYKIKQQAQIVADLIRESPMNLKYIVDVDGNYSFGLKAATYFVIVDSKRDDFAMQWDKIILQENEEKVLDYSFKI
jgi:hypothetical protein